MFQNGFYCRVKPSCSISTADAATVALNLLIRHISKRGLHCSCWLCGTHYDTLGIKPSATAREIKTKYYELSKTYHPDVNKTDGASKKFQEITEAYEVLGSDEKRSQYNQRLVSHPYHHSMRWPASDPFGRPSWHPSNMDDVTAEARFGARPLDEMDWRNFREFQEIWRKRAAEYPRGRTSYSAHDSFRAQYGGTWDERTFSRNREARTRADFLRQRMERKYESHFSLMIFVIIFGSLMAALSATIASSREREMERLQSMEMPPMWSCRGQEFWEKHDLKKPFG